MYVWLSNAAIEFGASLSSLGSCDMHVDCAPIKFAMNPQSLHGTLEALAPLWKLMDATENIDLTPASDTTTTHVAKDTNATPSFPVPHDLPNFRIAVQLAEISVELSDGLRLNLAHWSSQRIYLNVTHVSPTLNAHMAVSTISLHVPSRVASRKEAEGEELLIPNLDRICLGEGDAQSNDSFLDVQVAFATAQDATTGNGKKKHSVVVAVGSLR
jgi:hypothetical protein